MAQTREAGGIHLTPTLCPFSRSIQNVQKISSVYPFLPLPPHCPGLPVSKALSTQQSRVIFLKRKSDRLTVASDPPAALPCLERNAQYFDLIFEALLSQLPTLVTHHPPLPTPFFSVVIPGPALPFLLLCLCTCYSLHLESLSSPPACKYPPSFCTI